MPRSSRSVARRHASHCRPNNTRSPDEPKKILSTGRLDLDIKEAAKPAKAAGGLEGDWQAASFEQDDAKFSDRKYLSAAHKVNPIAAGPVEGFVNVGVGAALS
jgi:hypothetical protein